MSQVTSRDQPSAELKATVPTGFSYCPSSKSRGSVCGQLVLRRSHAMPCRDGQNRPAQDRRRGLCGRVQLKANGDTQLQLTNQQFCPPVHYRDCGRSKCLGGPGIVLSTDREQVSHTRMRPTSPARSSGPQPPPEANVPAGQAEPILGKSTVRRKRTS
jgi:hypothetical protein